LISFFQYIKFTEHTNNQDLKVYLFRIYVWFNDLYITSF